MAILTLPVRTSAALARPQESVRTETARRTGGVVAPASTGPARNGVVGVVGACTVALAPIGYLHVWAAASLDPVLVPISCYALLPGGGYLLLLVSCSLLALAGLVLAATLGRSGLPGMRLPMGLLISFAVAFLLVGLFRTVPFESHLASYSADIHRICASWGVICVPLVGGLVGHSCARTARTAYPRRLKRLAAVVGVLMAAFFAIHLPLMLLTGSGIPAFGFLERFGFAVIIAALVLTAITVSREGPGVPRPARTAAEPAFRTGR